MRACGSMLCIKKVSAALTGRTNLLREYRNTTYLNHATMSGMVQHWLQCLYVPNACVTRL